MSATLKSELSVAGIGDALGIGALEVSVTNDGRYYTGGLIGRNESGDITNSDAKGSKVTLDVTSRLDDTGNVVEVTGGGAPPAKKGTIAVSNEGIYYTAGLVGKNVGTFVNEAVGYVGNIENSNASSDVSVSVKGTLDLTVGDARATVAQNVDGDSYVGGFVKAEVKNEGDYYTAGLVGRNEDGSISSSDATGDVSVTILGDAKLTVGNVTAALSGDVIEGNRTLTGAVITKVKNAGHYYTGGLVGKNYGGDITGSSYNSKVTGVSVNVSGTSSLTVGNVDVTISGNVGGNSDVRDLIVSEVENEGEYYTGGLAGENAVRVTDGAGSISGNSDATGDVRVRVNGDATVLVGNINVAANDTVTGSRELISAVRAEAENEGNYYTGGLLGKNYGGDITGSSYSSNGTGVLVDITGTSTVNVGEIVLTNEGTSASSNVGSFVAGYVENHADYYTGGLVGKNEGASISGSDASENVTVSVDGHAAVQVSGNVNGQVDAEVMTKGNYYTGGLAGKNSGGDISDSYSTGDVKVTVNDAEDTVAKVTVSGDVNAGGAVAAKVMSQGNFYSGGLAGENYDGNITDSYATGDVTVTVNDATHDAATVTVVGNVSDGSTGVATVENTGNFYSGGLVGNHYGGTISGNFALGDVTVTINSGAVVEVGEEAAAGTVAANVVNTGNYYTGGLVGKNAPAEKPPVAPEAVSPLIPDSFPGVILQNYAAGDVTVAVNISATVSENNVEIDGAASVGNTASYYTGGLVGWNEGSISESFATGDVDASVTGNDSDTGGLVGHNDGSILNTYATGRVAGYDIIDVVPGDVSEPTSNTGGLVGHNTANGTIKNSYASGWDSVHHTDTAQTVTGDELSLGGVVGYNEGSVLNSFWNNDAPGLANGIGFPSTTPGDGTVEGKSTAQMKQMAIFLAAGWDIGDSYIASDPTPSVWRIYEGQSNPLLRHFLKHLKVTAVDDKVLTTDLPYSGHPGVIYDPAGPSGNLHGILTYTSDADKDGTFDLMPGGLYSDNQVHTEIAYLTGWDIEYAPGTLTVKIPEETPQQAPQEPIYNPGVVNQTYVAYTTASVTVKQDAVDPGKVTVSVPATIVNNNEAFSFTLPEAVSKTIAGKNETVSLVGGGGLPDWITYDSGTDTFTVTNPLADITDIKILVTVDGQSWEINIAVN